MDKMPSYNDVDVLILFYRITMYLVEMFEHKKINECQQFFFTNLNNIFQSLILL
jgi:hypothetical protein